MRKAKRWISRVVVWSAMGTFAEEVWEPKASTQPVIPETVRIVKQGMEHQRDDDGSVYGIASYHRYRVVTNTNGMLERASAGEDRKTFHDYDVDGDGSAATDSVEAHEFSLDRSLTPDAPWYETDVGSQRFYGGLSIYTADTLDPFGFTEDGMNGYEEGQMNQPRRNWAFFNEIYAIYEPFQMYGVWIW